MSESDPTYPPWALKSIGSRLVALAIEEQGETVFDELVKKLKLSDADLEKIMKEVGIHYDKVQLRCHHLSDVGIDKFSKALEDAEFKDWSESAKKAR